MKNIFTKFLSIIIVISAFMLQTNLQAQWAKQSVDGSNGGYGYGVTVDGSGNSYVIGRFSGTADFDPSEESTAELTATGSSDIYFAKYDANGAYQWAKQIGKTSINYGYGIALDGSGGLYITGYFKGTDVDFDPGAGTHNLSSAGEYDVFFAKYNTSNGSFVWAKDISGAETVNAYCLEVVGGYVYIVGRFEKTDVDFDPGPDEFLLSSVGSYDIFFARYSAADGSFGWAKRIGDSSNDYAYDMATDASGNMYITGILSGTIDFNPDAGTSNLTSGGERDVFYAKYASADGSLIWAKNVGTTGGSDANDYGYGIAVDASNNVYLTGRFEGTGDYDPGTGTTPHMISEGGYDTFIAKYNSGGDYIWAQSMGGADKVYGHDIKTDGTNVYVSGTFKGTADFGVGEVISLSSAGKEDVWFGKYNASNGNSQWAKKIGGTDIDKVDQYGNNIALGSLHITGYFYGTADFDPDPGVEYNLTSGGNCDAFNAKYTNDGVLPVELTTFSAQVSGNTVNLTWETATEVNNYGFNIERRPETGDWSMVNFVEGHGNSNSVKQYSFTDNVSLSGKYSYRLKQIDIDGTFEYSNAIEVTVGIPQKFEVAQNYPNPFNPTTTISFSLPNRENVQVVIYNTIGEIVKTLVNKDLDAGVHTYNFDASDLGSGIYFYKVSAGANVQTHKMILLK